jgi:hypothetical protein
MLFRISDGRSRSDGLAGSAELERPVAKGSGRLVVGSSAFRRRRLITTLCMLVEVGGGEHKRDWGTAIYHAAKPG